MMAKKVKKEKWVKVPATAFKTEEEDIIAHKKPGKYEKTLAVDMTFEELIKLSVSEDNPKENKPKSN